MDFALQGSRAHGAFAWGVLHRPLEESWLRIDGISGTSAGAMNAAVLTGGHARGRSRRGAARARGRLQRPRPHSLARCAARRSICCSAVGHEVHQDLTEEVEPARIEIPGREQTRGQTHGDKCRGIVESIGNFWRAVRFRLRLAASIITVVGNGVAFDLFEEAQQRARPKCFEESLVFRGNLASYQGVGPTLEAFALVRERRPNVRHRIISQAVFTPLEALARELGVRTRWT